MDLVRLNRASTSNFSFLGSLEVAQNYFPRGGVVAEPMCREMVAEPMRQEIVAEPMQY